MFIKFRYAISWICFLSLVLWNCPVSVIATEHNSIYTYLKEKLAGEERHDPPFFKLTTHKGREIYILGSIHDRHPAMLLSETNFQFIQGLSQGGAVLFIEHLTPYNTLMGELHAVAHDTAPDLWNIDQILNLSEKLVWNQIKESTFDYPEIKIPEIKIKYITKMDKIKGLLLFYEYMLDKEIEITLGFESTLLEWKNWKDISQLDDLNLGHKFLQENPQEAVAFFQLGLQASKSVRDYQTAMDQQRKSKWVKILLGYKDSIARYYYPWPNNKKQDDVTIGRNKMWCGKLQDYLSSNEKNEKPILIVCGAAHLKGENNFLTLLLETNLFSEAKRRDKDGQLKDL